MAQEKLIRDSGIPFTIVHSTQFFEFLGGIAQFATNGEKVRLSPAFVQPISSDDVAAALAEVAIGTPVNGTLEIAGPEQFRLSELVQQYLSLKKDPRKVVADVNARYFGAVLNEETLLPSERAHFYPTTFDAWLGRQKMAA